MLTKQRPQTKSAFAHAHPTTNETSDSQMLTLSNGKQVLNLMPELTGAAAIVDLKTLMRLAGMLPKANVNNIIEQMNEKLVELLTTHEMHNMDKLKLYIEMLTEELAFHKTINLISMVEVPEPADPLPIAELG